MRRQAGFTLIEIMVVIAILGILAVTAMPFYQTWTQRAYGTQALALMRNFMDAQIMYHLEKDEFFPPVGDAIFIPYEGDGAPSPATAIEDLESALAIKITQNRHFDYTIINYGDEAVVTIRAPFALFKDRGRPGTLTGRVTKQGQVDYVGP